MKKIYVSMLFVFIATSLFAQIPQTLSYEGLLTDAAGFPKPDGDYFVTFALYTQNSGGTSIWSEGKHVSVIKGLFSTRLGDVTPFGSGVKFDTQYFLGIAVGSGAELTPRVPLNSAPYSFTSMNSNSANDVIGGKVVKSLNGLKDNVTLQGSGGTTVTSTGNTITVSSSSTGGTGIQSLLNTDNNLSIQNPAGPTTTVNFNLPLFLNGAVNYPNLLLGAITSGTGAAIIGQSVSGIGTAGVINGSTGTGFGYGVYGGSSIPSGYGVYGENTATSGEVVGIYGTTRSSIGIGVWGQGGFGGIQGIATNASGGFGVQGANTSTTGIGYGVEGITKTPNGSGLVGIGPSGVTAQGSTYGIVASGNTAGIIAYNSGAAGMFFGEVDINGNLNTSGVKHFKIDHPLDPENKFLVHSSIESPDVMNIYNGNITTDANGYATVNLPSYFEALNINYKYQLTVIDQFAQAIIGKKIQNNSFIIRTDKPNVEVSWQVTGIRNDPYMKANPVVVELEKNAQEKGKYYFPELYGQNASKALFDYKSLMPDNKIEIKNSPESINQSKIKDLLNSLPLKPESKK